MNSAGIDNQQDSTGGGRRQALVSVIVITYNQADYIEAAVRSCMSQSYQHIEIIVSDDASSDATVAIAQQLRAEDERVKVHSAVKNRGITGNVQFALEQCRGKYIAFLGGDDLLYPEKIAAQVACMEADPDIALCFTQCHIIHGTDLTPVRVTADTHISDVADGYQLAGNFAVEMPGPAPMIRASMIPAGGFRSVAPIASDWLFFIETSYRHKCKLIKTPLAAYRIHSNNIGKNRYNYVGDYISSFNFIKENYAADPRLVRLARLALKRYLSGTFYASIVDGNPAVARTVTQLYKDNVGVDTMAIGMSFLHRMPLAGLFATLKPVLKRFV